MSARSPADVFANASTVVESGGGQKPRIVTTFPDLDTAHEAAALFVAWTGRSPMSADTPADGARAEGQPNRRFANDPLPGLERALRLVREANKFGCTSLDIEADLVAEVASVKTAQRRVLAEEGL